MQGAFLPVPPLLGGAVEKVWFALGREFARRGHNMTHVSRSFDGQPADAVDSGVRHRRVRGSDTPHSLWRLKLADLQYTLRAQRVLPPASVLVTNTFWLPLLERRRSRGRPYVHVARFPKGQLRLYPRRSLLQTVSEPIRTAILHEAPAAADRVRVIPYPLSPVYFTPLATAEPVLLYTGRIHPEKGVHLLLEAFLRLVQEGERHWKLRLIGPWETRQGGGGAEYRQQLLELARRAPGRIDLCEPIFDEQALVAEYRRAAVFVYPSLAEFGETFGLAVLEAMAAGCAPVVSALACFRDFVRPGDNGVIFNHRASDPAGELARTLEPLLQTPSLLESLRAKAWTTARGYSLDMIADRFLEDFATFTERPAADRSNLAHASSAKHEWRAS